MSAHTTIIELINGQPTGQGLAIDGLSFPPDIKDRLLKAGLAPGTECAVVRYTPLDDPRATTVRGCSVVQRSSEWTSLQVCWR